MNGENAPSYSSDDASTQGVQKIMAQEIVAEVISESVLSVGQQLRTTREAKGLSVDDVAKSIKLSQRQIEALEADDWPSLPCKTIIRGFVRNYARMLQLNPDALMMALDGLQMPPAPELSMSSGTPVSIPHEGAADRRDYARVLMGLVVLIFAVLAFFFVPQELWQSTLSALKAATQSGKVTAEKTVVPATEDAKLPEAEISPPATNVLPDVSTPPLAPAVPVAPPSSSSLNGLKFSFTRPAWVEVRDRSGQIIFSQLSQAGSQREIEGQPPFALVVGNAAHVTLQYKGKSVDLSRRSRDDVARLTLE